MPNRIQQDRLWTKNFLLLCSANFLFYFAFYLLMPILPFYLMDVFHTDGGMVGLIISSYTIAVLAIRPFSGFLADTFARKPMYIIAYFLFTAFFVGYLFAGVLSVFLAFRVLQGFTFGTVSTSGNTLVIDITPSSRRGEALGYYGALNNLALAIGPMVSLFLKNTTNNYDILFYAAIVSGTIGLFLAFLIKAPPKIPQKHEAISLDRFILLKGIPAAISLMLITIPYGMTNTYIAMYAEKVGLVSNIGLFFLIMAGGLIFSRISSGKKVDQGQMSKVIQQGYIFVIGGLLFEILLHYSSPYHILLSYACLYLAAFFLGYGYGTLIPALNTLFINLAPNNRRATANSTYLTSWDIGIGCGILLGGYLSEWMSFPFMYAFGFLLSLIALFLYKGVVMAHFSKNRLR